MIVVFIAMVAGLVLWFGGMWVAEWSADRRRLVPRRRADEFYQTVHRVKNDLDRRWLSAHWRLASSIDPDPTDPDLRRSL